MEASYKKGVVLKRTIKALKSIHRLDEDRVSRFLSDVGGMKGLDSGDGSEIRKVLTVYLDALGYTLEHELLRQRCLTRIAAWVRQYNEDPAEAEAIQNL